MRTLLPRCHSLASTRQKRDRRVSCVDTPRARGHHFGQSAVRLGTGPSAHARGAHTGPLGSSCQPGTTPACAGST
jgi:hypothetical protein